MVETLSSVLMKYFLTDLLCEREKKMVARLLIRLERKW